MAERFRILIIEDDEVTRTLLQRMLLRRFPCQVEMAADGREGLEKIRSLRPELVLLDVMLPELTGLEVLQAIRADPVHAALPVVVMSSRSDREAVIPILHLGVMNYLLKPLKSDVVTKRIGQILSVIRKPGMRAKAGGVQAHRALT